MSLLSGDSRFRWEGLRTRCFWAPIAASNAAEVSQVLHAEGGAWGPERRKNQQRNCPLALTGGLSTPGAELGGGLGCLSALQAGQCRVEARDSGGRGMLAHLWSGGASEWGFFLHPSTACFSEPSAARGSAVCGCIRWSGVKDASLAHRAWMRMAFRLSVHLTRCFPSGHTSSQFLPGELACLRARHERRERLSIKATTPVSAS